MAVSVSLQIACHGEGWAVVPTLARRHRLGVEVGDFADPDLLEGEWRGRWQEIRSLLKGVPGRVTLHGPRSDLNPGLRDRGLTAFCRQRYQLALEVAAEIGAERVVFHTGFNPMIRAPGFEGRWIKRCAVFWRDLAEAAEPEGVGIALENLWEPRPEIQRDLIDAVGSPLVRACFDVGHSNIYSQQPPERWVSCLGGRLACVHLHNNDGREDSHSPLEDGTVDFSRFLPLLLLSSEPPCLVLEVSGGRQDLEDSLFFLRRLLSLELGGVDCE
jgi:sugar phosphate isomerase/epimerase